MKARRWLSSTAFALLLPLAQAQDFPTKPVKIVVPFTAGSATDILARTVGQKLNEMWNQSVLIENRPGAGGTIAAGAVAKSVPDGTTLMVHSSGHAANAFIYPTLPYDTLKDFVQVVPLAGQPNVLVTSPASGYKTVADLIADAKKRPGAVNFGSAGIGSGTHFNAEKFKLAAGIDVIHVPYKGTPEAMTDTIAGRVSYFFSPISAALPQVRDGKLVALAVSSAKRSTLLPNVPTVAESGLPGFDYNLWVGVFAPAGTPTDVIDKINRSVNRVLGEADVQARMAALGAEPMSMNPAEFDRFMRAEMDDAAKVVKAAGIKAQ
ncbi:MAG TPA: tripartite tricarboxylate transporter substrate binding protein [Burkholderiaceae bacterium]|nr:tripartite tricarboxylate transporter substrate binding protein [Burkholderiaceae bacterium]